MKSNKVFEEAQRLIEGFSFEREERDLLFYRDSVRSLIKMLPANITEELYVCNSNCRRAIMIFKTDYHLEDSYCWSIIVYANYNKGLTITSGLSSKTPQSYHTLVFEDYTNYTLNYTSGKYKVRKEIDVPSFLDVVTDPELILKYRNFAESESHATQSEKITYLKRNYEKGYITYKMFQDLVSKIVIDPNFTAFDLIEVVNNKCFEKVKELDDIVFNTEMAKLHLSDITVNHEETVVKI